MLQPAGRRPLRPRQADRTSRRRRDRWIRTTVAALLIGVVGIGTAACGRPPEPPANAGAQPQAGFPVNVKHKFGTTAIPQAPQRVVVIGTSTDDLDAVLALGVTPVAFFTTDQSTPDGRYPWLADRLDPARTQVINAANGVDMEQVVRSRPDLILATGYFGLDQDYATLSKIAPTIGYEHEWGKQTWQQHVQVVGSALGKPAEAERLVAETEKTITDVRNGLPGLAGKTFSVSMGNAPGQVFTLVSREDFAVRQIERLGLTLSPALAGTEQVSGSPTGVLGAEQLDKLDADLLVIAFATPQAQHAFETNPLVRNTPAMTSGSYVVADRQLISQLRYPSALGIPWALDKLRPGLEKAAAKP
ncbi:iron-siderophore ABC transporter substrate-binding protein [Saccharopolyspora taberi]|uniref:Iron-siderophore ABC transporter substrate-binding protein n=1 Tax=Saccharopolyspora taberi TaxID=60895 RepID=A0ABN3VH30_9PSEU